MLQPFFYIPFQNYLLLTDPRFQIIRKSNQIDIFASLEKLRLIHASLQKDTFLYSSWIRQPPIEERGPSLALVLKQCNYSDFEAYVSSWLRDNYDRLIPPPL